MEPEERIEIVIDELERLRYGFEIVQDDYRQAKIDVAVDMIRECEEMIQDCEKVDEWPDGSVLSDVDWYENRLEQ